MNIQEFLQHHGIVRNPFAEEDAQTDPVFKDHCIVSTYHPTWEKVYGDPAEPSTSVVFGEKGSGKTAIRLQIARHLSEYNREHPRQRLFVIQYDDFNPFLDRFHARMRGRKRRADRTLAEWKLWDHMDAILSLGMTGLVDRILQVRQPSHNVDGEVRDHDVDQLDRYQARDLLLLSACYDQSVAETYRDRWMRLRQRVHFSTWRAHWHLVVAYLGTVSLATLAILLVIYAKTSWLTNVWYLWLVALGVVWLPWLRKLWQRFRMAVAIRRHVRTGNLALGPLRQVLMRFTSNELASQPLPIRQSTDARYELLVKFQTLLECLGFHGIIVLVDRVDEPHLINGSAERMKALVWPLLDNKLLTHPGMGLKMMLPIELTRFMDREGREFYQRARLDKQNMISSFQWSGEALYDVANARIKACAAPDASPTIRDLFDPSVSDQRILEVMRNLRVPRHLFKFLYRLFVEHASAHTAGAPQWQIRPETLEATLAVFRHSQDAFDRGAGPG